MIMNTYCPVFENSLIGFDSYKKHGYYQVGDKIFNHKIRALQHATSTNQPVQWFFNPEVFGNLDWQTSSGMPLDEIYRLRAQQLREKYDYLVLFFSGGADSTNILQSFVNNGIKLDEVVVGWPISQTKNRYTPNAQETSPKNYLSEWDYSIKPKLDWLAHTHPEVKITLCDVLADPKNLIFSQDLATLLPNCSYVGISRNIELDKVLRSRAEKYRSCAAIYGYSPVECAVANNKYLVAYFCDGVLGGGLMNDFHALTRYQRNIEYFYWTPDMPEIVREQGHAMLKYLTSNPTLISVLTQLNQKLQYVSCGDWNIMHRIRKKILYPNWQECFQADKPSDQIGFSSWQAWWHDNPHSQEFVTQWESAINSEISAIDPKYLQLRRHEKNQGDLLTKSLTHGPSAESVIHYKSIFSKPYLLGIINNNI
jgi:hypothetical protein